MSVIRPALAALLMLGVSAGALRAQPATGASLFGTPPASSAAFVPGPALGFSGAMLAAKPITVGPWALDRPKAVDPAQPAAAAEQAIDLSALRYYAHANDLARVAAEIRLLRAKYPGWEAPADLFTEVQGGESEQPLWDLFAKHDLEGLKAAMDDRRQRTPGWQPSGDLAGKLALADAGDLLTRASEAKDWGSVVDIAAANRGLMTCGSVDALWRTAEALVHLDDEPHAVDAYRYVLANCANPQERLATVQKAAALVKAPEAMDALMRMGRRTSAGTGEFEQVRLDDVRRTIGAAAAGQAGAAPTAADLDRIAVGARAPGGGKDAELLGWYALSKKDFAQAETWFRASLQGTPSPKAAEGLVLALRDGGKTPEAIELSQTYAGLGPLNQKLMVEILTTALADAKTPLTPAQQAALATGIDAQKSADAAQSYGWSRFKSGDLSGAEIWFRKAADWQPSESAAIGLLLVAHRLQHQADYAKTLGQYRTTYPRVAELDAAMRPTRRQEPRVRKTASRHAGTARRTGGDGGWDPSATAIVKTFEGGNIDQALALMDERKARRAEPQGLTVVRGWALYKKGDWDQAKQVFTALNKTGMSSQASEGLRQIELGYTNPRYR